MRHRSSISWPFESFTIQKTKLAPLSCRVASDWEEVCESRGQGGEGFEAGTVVWWPGACPGPWPFSSISACGMKVPTLSSFDCLAENGCICGCFSFFLFLKFNPHSRCFLWFWWSGPYVSVFSEYRTFHSWAWFNCLKYVKYMKYYGNE